MTGEIRVGVDLCAVHDVEAAIASFGDRYLNAIYTEAELDYCTTNGYEYPDRLAARFAAKEATLKVLRPNRTGVNLRSIEVCRHDGGWCDIHLEGSAARLAQEANIGSLAVSISHEAGVAAAVVVADASGHSATEGGSSGEQ